MGETAPNPIVLGDNWYCKNAQFFPQSITGDISGYLYVSDAIDGGRIRKIDPKTGYINTVAGGGTSTLTGPATAGKLTSACQMVVDRNGDMYIADCTSAVFKVVAATGTMSTIVGKVGTYGSTDGVAGTSALLRNVMGVALGANGELYVGDTNNHVVRKFTFFKDIVNRVAGKFTSTGIPTPSGDGGPAIYATFATPSYLYFDANKGDLYICSLSNHNIRKIDARGLITTFAGSSSGTAISSAPTGFYKPSGVWGDSLGNIYVGDATSTVKRFDKNGVGSYLAGNREGYSGADMVGTLAVLSRPMGMYVDASDNVYFGDNRRPGDGAQAAYNSQVIRTVSTRGFPFVRTGRQGDMSVVAGNIANLIQEGVSTGDGYYATSTTAWFPSMGACAVDGFGDLYFTNPEYPARMVDHATNNLSSLTGGPTTDGIAIDMGQNLYYSEYVSGISVIRRVNLASGILVSLISSVAASTTTDGDEVTASSAKLGLMTPTALVFDTSGRLYFNDKGKYVLRRYDPVTNKVKVVAGTRNTIATATLLPQDGTQATSCRLMGPRGVWVDAAGQVYFGDDSAKIYRVAVDGTIKNIVGQSAVAYTGNDGPGTSAGVGLISHMSGDSRGNIYWCEQNGFAVRRWDASSEIVSLFAGTGTQGIGMDGAPATLTMLKSPRGIFVDQFDNVYFTDASTATPRVGVVRVVYSGDPSTDTSAAAEATAICALISGMPSLLLNGWSCPAILTDRPWCHGWRGISCDSNTGSMVEVNLGGMALRGTLPTSIGSFSMVTSLTSLKINDNQLSGIIPLSIGLITTLQTLQLDNNGLIGFIPKTLGSLAGLTQLSIRRNSLQGYVPSQLGNLRKLVSLRLDNNLLTGSLPTSLGALAFLSVLNFNGNHMDDWLPAPLNDNKANLFLDDTLPQTTFAIQQAPSMGPTPFVRDTGRSGVGRLGFVRRLSAADSDSSKPLITSSEYNRSLSNTKLSVPFGIAINPVTKELFITGTTYMVKAAVQSGVITGSSTVNVADASSLGSFYNIRFDSSGNLYFMKTYRIMRRTPAGVVSNFIGTGSWNGINANGMAAGSISVDTRASWGPPGLTIDRSDKMYFYHQDNAQMGMYDIATSTFVLLWSGSAACASGPATSARTYIIIDLVADSSSNLYAADYICKVVWKYNAQTKYISVYAGTVYGGETNAGRDGPATSSYFKKINAVAMDQQVNLYVASQEGLIQKVTPAGMMTTIVATDAVSKMVWDDLAGVLYFTESNIGDHAVVAYYPNRLTDEVAAAVVRTTASAVAAVYATPAADAPYTFDGSLVAMKTFTDGTLAVGTSDATVALWMDFASFPNTCYFLTLGRTAVSGGSSMYMYVEQSTAVGNPLLLKFTDSGVSGICLISSASVSQLFSATNGTQGPVHIAFVRMLSTGKGYYYLNGVMIDTTTTSGSVTCTWLASPLVLGGDPSDSADVSRRRCMGTMHDVAIYKAALTADQIQDHMYSTIKAASPSQDPTAKPSLVPTFKPTYKFTGSPSGKFRPSLPAVCIRMCIGSMNGH